MSRKKVAHRPEIRSEWMAILRDAWKRLDHGKKKAAYDAAGMSRSSAHRIIDEESNQDDFSYDTLEALRLAINSEISDEAERIPPAIASIRSRAHHQAIEAVNELDDLHQLDVLAEWIAMGARLAERGSLPEVMEALATRAEAERMIEQSSDAISKPLPITPIRAVRSR